MNINGYLGGPTTGCFGQGIVAVTQEPGAQPADKQRVWFESDATYLSHLMELVGRTVVQPRARYN